MPVLGYLAVAGHIGRVCSRCEKQACALECRRSRTLQVTQLFGSLWSDVWPYLVSGWGVRVAARRFMRMGSACPWL
jgi:hypothetical protein